MGMANIITSSVPHIRGIGLTIFKKEKAGRNGKMAPITREII